MKLIDMTCPHCKASLKVDSSKKQAFCEYCGAKLLIDDEVQHVHYDNAEDAGYQFEKGRQRAQAEQRKSDSQKVVYVVPEKKKKNNMVWWIIGWICCFPIPLTILIVRNEKLSKKAKAIIIAVIWLLILAIGVGGAGDNADSDDTVVKTTKFPITTVTTTRESSTNSKELSTSEEDTTKKTVKFKESKKLKTFLEKVVSNSDRLTTDEAKSIGEALDLSCDVHMGWGGTSWTYYFKDTNNKSCSVILNFVAPVEENYTEHLRSWSFIAYEKTDYLNYYSEWDEGYAGNEKLGYYIGNKSFDTFDQAYKAYVNTKN